MVSVAWKAHPILPSPMKAVTSWCGVESRLEENSARDRRYRPLAAIGLGLGLGQEGCGGKTLRVWIWAEWAITTGVELLQTPSRRASSVASVNPRPAESPAMARCALRKAGPPCNNSQRIPEQAGENGYHRPMNGRANRLELRGASKRVSRNIGSGPTGRWFKSSRPDHSVRRAADRPAESPPTSVSQPFGPSMDKAHAP